MEEEYLIKIINSKSKTFLAFCFCFLAGTAFISIIDFSFDFVFAYFGLLVGVGFLIFFWKNKIVRIVLLCMVAIILAFGRYVLFLPNAKNIVNNAGENLRFSAVVIQEPDVRMDSVRYTVETQGEFEGRVYFKMERYPRYNYGDVLDIACELKKAEKIEEFRFDKYLALKKTFVFCSAPQVEKVGEGAGNPLMTGVLTVKNIVANRINKLWHEPEASFVAGLLYGYRGGLGELQNDFNTTGVTHIVAISGYNIAIIGAIFIVILSFLRIPRKKAFWIVVFAISVFVLFAGAGASVVRAGIMGILVLVAKQLGRSSKSINMLLLTAVLMVLNNPFILVWDAGFQLSFIATAGLIFLSPKIDKFLEKLPEFFGIKKVFIETSSAIIVTLPLTLYYFGRFSVVALFVNILILWIVPWIMLFSFSAVIASFVFYPLGLLISWATWFMLKYVILIVEYFASLFFASVDFHISAVMVLAFYLALLFGKRIYTFFFKI